MKSVSYKELVQHKTYLDAWIAINDIIYDITSFINKHPGGDVFTGLLGSDCSGLFSTAHLMHKQVENSFILDKEFLKQHKIKIIGKLCSDTYNYRTNTNTEDKIVENRLNVYDRILYTKSSQDKFWIELKNEIFKYLKTSKIETKYSDFEAMLLILYYLLIYIFLFYFSFIRGSFIFMILLTFHLTAAACNIAHMATHEGFCRNPTLNFIAKQFFDLSGGSWLSWTVLHNTHHSAPHSPFDYQTNDTTPFIRLHSYKDYYKHYKYQYIYFWILVVLYGPISVGETTVFVFKWCFTHPKHRYFYILSMLMFRALFVFQFYYVAVYVHNSYIFAVKLFVIYMVSISYWVYLLLYAVHENVKQTFVDRRLVTYKHNTYSWAKIQIQTAGNWFVTNLVGRFVQFHIGFFNYHIEHHLFPTFRPDIYPLLSVVVQNVCEKHNIAYVSTGFIELVQSQQRDFKNKGLCK